MVAWIANLALYRLECIYKSITGTVLIVRRNAELFRKACGTFCNGYKRGALALATSLRGLCLLTTTNMGGQEMSYLLPILMAFTISAGSVVTGTAPPPLPIGIGEKEPTYDCKAPCRLGDSKCMCGGETDKK